MSKGAGDADRDFRDPLPKCPECKIKTVSKVGKLCVDCRRKAKK